MLVDSKGRLVTSDYVESGEARNNVKPMEWHYFSEKVPRAGVFVCVLNESGQFYLAVRQKDTGRMYFSKGHFISHPLMWSPSPELIK